MGENLMKVVQEVMMIMQVMNTLMIVEEVETLMTVVEGVKTLMTVGMMKVGTLMIVVEMKDLIMVMIMIMDVKRGKLNSEGRKIQQNIQEKTNHTFQNMKICQITKRE